MDPPLDRALRNPEVPSVYRLRHAPAGELEAYLRSRNPGSELLAPLFRQASDAAFAELLEGDHTELALRQAERLAVPGLVVQADPAHGGVLGDGAAQRLREVLPHGELVKVEGASHSVHASQPAQLAAIIKSWDTRARRPPGPGSTAAGASRLP